MTLLVTGAAGFLGAATMECARRAGLDAVPTARAGAGMVAANLEDHGAVRELLNAVRPTAIINCAASVVFDSGTLARQYAVNTLAPAVMAQWAGQHGVHLVHVSTVIVHGTRVPRVGPSTSIAPDTDYGRSKWIAEENIIASGCSSAIVRCGGIFGRQGPAHLGLNVAIRGAAAGELPVVVGTGSARRNYVHVADAAAALVHCALSGVRGVYWMGGRDVLTIRAMLGVVCDVYLPGQKPTTRDGTEGADQIIDTSAELPAGRSFRDAVLQDR